MNFYAFLECKFLEGKVHVLFLCVGGLHIVCTESVMDGWMNGRMNERWIVETMQGKHAKHCI